MSYSHAVLLALLQALTEFLPVSSSGHLILAQRMLGSGEEVDILFDVLLHLGTATAVLLYLRREVATLLSCLFSSSAAGSQTVFAGSERRAVGYILLANLPTGILGLLMMRYLVDFVTRADVVGFMLMVTGTLLWLGRRQRDGRPMAEMQPRDALVIGLVQGFAVLPGISRSGSTITAGILLGVERDLAARFSLLISVPVILAASILELTRVVNPGSIPVGPYVAGMLVAGVAGYLAIDLILRLVRGHRFYLFAFYLWPVGAAAILWQHLG